MKYLFLIIFLPGLASADPFRLTEEEVSPSTEDILIRKKEKHLRDESMIYDLNSSLGIRDQRKYTGSDKNRFSISGLVSSDYEHFSETLGVDVSYLRRTERYDQLWWGLQVFGHQTLFGAVTQNQSVGTNPNSDSQIKRPQDSEARVFAGGLGVSYRFKLLLDFLRTEDVFESVDVFANVVEFDEAVIEQKYRGYGLTTNYGIHKRSSTSFFYGGKLSYNIASVKRDAIGTESASDRSFSLGWLTMGFEMGFFY
ncbi:MAG TPA: hypothetical protein VNJ01_15440 [Bacteriovoracaceae bacterium]|nr:hypothetical protein [Bacteriovoracaceae bacterium]